MATFPRSAAGVGRLARNLIQGLIEHGDLFPAPPVSPDELAAAVEEFTAECAATAAAVSAAKERRASKNQAFRALIERMKRDIRYAENTVSDDDAKLKLIGWGAPAPKVSRPIEPPGQVRNLEHVCLDDGSISLRWQKPADGGKVVIYKVQSHRPGGPGWLDVDVAVLSEIVLSDQERDAEMWYRVIALNEAGEGSPSNIIAVTP